MAENERHPDRILINFRNMNVTATIIIIRRITSAELIASAKSYNRYPKPFIPDRKLEIYQFSSVKCALKGRRQ